MVLCILFFMALTLGGLLTDQLNNYVIGKELKELAALHPDSALLQNSKWMNALSIVVAFLLPAALFAYLAYPKPIDYVKLNRHFSAKYILFAVLLLFISIPASDWLQQASSLIPVPKSMADIEKQLGAYTNTLLGAKKVTSYLVSLLAICLVPAIVEELFFRGVLQQILLTWSRRSPWLAILIASIVFSLLHGHMAGFLSRTLLGFLLGLVFFVSGNLWLSILLHFINNALAVTLSFLHHSGRISTDFNSIQQPDFVGIICLLLSVVGMYYLFIIRKPFEYVTLQDDAESNNNVNYE